MLILVLVALRVFESMDLWVHFVSVVVVVSKVVLSQLRIVCATQTLHSMQLSFATDCSCLIHDDIFSLQRHIHTSHMQHVVCIFQAQALYYIFIVQTLYRFACFNNTPINRAKILNICWVSYTQLYWYTRLLKAYHSCSQYVLLLSDVMDMVSSIYSRHGIDIRASSFSVRKSDLTGTCHQRLQTLSNTMFKLKRLKLHNILSSSVNFYLVIGNFILSTFY